MSWSLAVRNGDLALGNARYGIVTGSTKLVQDLRLHLLEHMGTDPFHPGYGSTIDGGVLPNGAEVPGVVGEQNTELVAMEVESEIRRIALTYQEQQLSRAQRERLRFNKTTLTKGEILLAIQDITMIQNQDTIVVTVQLQTGADTPVTLDLLLEGPVG